MLLITMVLSPSSPVTSRHGPSAAMLLARAAGCTASFGPRAAFGNGVPVAEDEMVPLVIAHAQAELACEEDVVVPTSNPAAVRLSAALATLVSAAAASRDLQKKTKNQLYRPVEALCAALDDLAPAPEPEAGEQPREGEGAKKCPLALLRRMRLRGETRHDGHDLEKGNAGQGTR